MASNFVYKPRFRPSAPVSNIYPLCGTVHPAVTGFLIFVLYLQLSVLRPGFLELPASPTREGIDRALGPVVDGLDHTPGDGLELLERLELFRKEWLPRTTPSRKPRTWWT